MAVAPFCATLSFWAELKNPFGSARDDSKISDCHDVPGLQVDVYHATELTAMVVS